MSPNAVHCIAAALYTSTSIFLYAWHCAHRIQCVLVNVLFSSVFEWHVYVCMHVITKKGPQTSVQYETSELDYGPLLVTTTCVWFPSGNGLALHKISKYFPRSNFIGSISDDLFNDAQVL